MPSCSRVKLNRASLKYVTEVLPAQRRRRLPKSVVTCTAGPPKHEDSVSAELRSETDTASAPCGNKPIQSFVTHLTGPKGATGAPSNGELTGSGPGERRATKPRCLQACAGSDAEFQPPDGPNTRGTDVNVAVFSGSASSPLRRTLGKQRLRGGSPKTASPPAVTDDSKKIVIWIKPYPRVTLCDVARSADLCPYNCGYALPDVLESSPVRCFKRDMRAGFRFTPGCFGHNKHGSNQKTLRDACAGVPSESQNESENRKRLGCLDSQRLSKHTGSRIHKRPTSEDSATPDSSSLAACKAEHEAGGDVGDCRESQFEIRKEKRAKLGNDFSSAVGSALEENCDGEQICSWTGGVRGSDGAQMSSEHEEEADTDDPETFTCQRVRVYLRKMHFSCARTYMSWPFANGDPTRRSQVPPDDPRARNESDAKTRPDSLCNRIGGVPSSAPAATQKRIHDCRAAVPSHPVRKGVETAPRFELAEESVATFSTLPPRGGQPGTDALPSPSLPANGLEDDGSVSTPSPASYGPSDWETTPTLSPMPSPFARGCPSSRLSATPSSLPPPAFQLQSLQGVQSGAGRKTSFHGEESRMASSSSQSSALTDSPDSCSSFLLLQDPHMSDEELSTDESFPPLVPFTDEICLGFERFLLPPVLSPVTSPRRHSWRRSLSGESSSHSHDEERQTEVSVGENGFFHARHKTQIGNKDTENSKDHSGKGIDDIEGVLNVKVGAHTSPGDSQPSSSSDEDESNDDNLESDAEQSCGASEQSSSDPESESGLPPGARTTEPGSSPGGQCEAEAAGGSQPGFMDEFAAYEQDILLVDVDQEDPELFDNLPEKSLLKLGPVRVFQAAKTKPNKGLIPVCGPAVSLGQKWTSGMTTFHCSSPDNEDESTSRPWRPHCRVAPTGSQPINCHMPPKQNRIVYQSDAVNSRVNGTLERFSFASRPPVQTASTAHNIPQLMSGGSGPCITNTAGTTEFRHQKFKAYCRLYFSEAPSCTFKMCRFQHLPLEGDEKFCMENVARFINNPLCLPKAGAVYSGYYQDNPPGVYFSMSVFLALLWASLRAGMVPGILSVLHVSLAHNIVVSVAAGQLPSHEFLLALFNYVREKSLMGFVPELMWLTFKMAGAGLELSLDCLDCVKNTPLFQQMVHASSPPLFPSSAVIPEHLNLAHASVEMELCIKQEDWRRVGQVFRIVCQSCQSCQHPNQVERISGRVAIALLSECKDKLSLPFAAFAEAACQLDGKENLVRNFVGRIGVSLMLRYHKTQHWMKGRRVVETLSLAKVNYFALKGLFGNEDRASRCYLITVASELFLLSGSVEGALNTLRENKWFLSSCSWPCEPADLESRTRVLVHLSEKTSHRDTLEVLCNLPGMQEPNDLVDISKFCPLFKSHLQVCVERQVLPVAADMADFMLSKKLAVDLAVLQLLFQKMGRQNLWLRAREIFRHSLKVGYYPGVSAPPGFMTLMVPCQLGEVELALAFEMFITVNATAIFRPPEAAGPVLSVTLKRTQSSESEYLSAGSRLLSAAGVLQPKVIVHYTPVNAAQEQMFTVDVTSAQRWLRHNHLWASKMWAE